MSSSSEQPAPSTDAEALRLRQEVQSLRDQLNAAEARAERPDPWDPKVIASRARRIASAGKRTIRRVRDGRQAPKVAVATTSEAPSAFVHWQRRIEGSRFVGFPVDWRFSRIDVANPAPIAVVVHCHFPELLADLLAELAHIPEEFDLYITNSSGTVLDGTVLSSTAAKHVEVLTVENHGRDIWPLVQVVNAGILDPYRIVLKVHTKKSTWRESHAELAGDGATWRASLTEALLGSPENVRDILSAMRADPDIASVTADGSVVGTEHWGGDLDLVRGIYQRLSMPLDPDILRFPAGSMYWIRGFILQGLRAFRFDRDDFEEEAGQVDGTCAHAIERMIGLLATEAGMRTLERSDVASDPAATTPCLRARVVPFYLPQFHAFAENDRWWGKGFTEWTNVMKATPLYPGHPVPLRPTELGYYNLELDAVRAAQRDLAVDHGIAGFMYYYYWFAGKRLMDMPIERLLASDIDQQFCIMWANENWTRRWDGGDTDILIGQEYETVPAETFIDDVMPLLKDPRYMRVDGAVVLAVYKLGQLPDPAAAIAHWRERCREEGVGDILLLQVDVGVAMDGADDGIADIIDGSLAFAPHNLDWRPSELPRESWDARFHGNPMSFRGMADRYADRMRQLDDSHFPGAMVTFDNTARRQWRPDAFTGSNPYTFRRWLCTAIDAVQARPEERRVVFVNAWNEWAESAVLEPTEQFGRSYLHAVRSAVELG